MAPPSLAGPVSVSVDVVQPGLVFEVLSADDVCELRTEFHGDRADDSLSDWSLVDVCDGCDLSGGTGHPDLISGDELCPAEIRLLYIVPKIPGDLDQ